MKIKELRQAWKENQIKALKSVGFTGSFRSLRVIENRANRLALDCCEWLSMDESPEFDRRYTAIEESVKKLFGGSLPPGFFINLDPRGYALKIDNTKVSLPMGINTDWGGYGILAPDFSDMN
jgi:hypothetical protein